MTFQLMMMYHHTKFGHKRLNGSKDIIQTKSGHTVSHTDSRKHKTPGQTDTAIPIYPLNSVTGVRCGGYKKNAGGE